MNCPKCAKEMERVTFENIEVDRCTGCSGLWFDMLEHEQLKDIEGSESLDIGKARVGRRFDEVGKVECPACGSRMIPMVDNEQPHIWYEGCTVCHGVFFDAGEFRDYKKHGVLDFFRDLLRGERAP